MQRDEPGETTVHRVLGVSCASADAFLTVVEVDADGDTIVPVGPDRVRPVSAGDHGEALARSLEAWERLLDTIGPDAVALLLPEGGQQTKRPHSTWAGRCESETIVSVACGRKQIPIDVLSRATVRSRLEVHGNLDEAVRKLTPTGKYWKDRGLALLAARAVAIHAASSGWPALRGSADRKVADGAAAR